MLVINDKKHTRRYVYGGSGIFDTITSIITSKAAQEVGKHVAKTAGTKLVEKGIEKAFQPKKSKLNKESQAILNDLLTKSSVPIQNYVKGSGMKKI